MENKEIEFVNKETETKKVDVIDSKCPSCGSELSFDPKTQGLVCRNCNYKQEINKNVENVEEYDYQTYLERYNSLKGNLPDEYEIKCSDCGATIIVNANAISTTCPFYLLTGLKNVFGLHQILNVEKNHLLIMPFIFLFGLMILIQNPHTLLCVVTIIMLQ